ncbi:hypothetical protein F2Q69_00051191 [Brassica cretica]|uniref:Secreted protein n=1 Tax=Brassica cretica TaxID=69181 RepID=A0A8S9PQX4_BRACR|nr:hypothetical protein F2Q69_00051191 [Brassica cretica]
MSGPALVVVLLSSLVSHSDCFVTVWPSGSTECFSHTTSRGRQFDTRRKRGGTGSPCSGDCRVLRAVVGAPCSRVSLFLLVYLCVVSAEEDGAVSSYRSLPLAWSFSPVRFFFSQISSSSLRIGGAWVVGGPLQVFSHLSGWLVTDGGYGVLLGFRLRALCSGHQTLALFSTGGLQWVAWGICKVGLRALLTVVLVAAHCGSLRLPLHSSELPAVWRSSPLSVLHLLCADCATPEVVYLSSPIVLYGLLVKWVYTVPVDGLEGGNLRERLLNDGIACLCHYLVPLVVAPCNQGLRAPFSRARGNRRLSSFALVLWSELASLFSGTLDAPALLSRALGLVCKLVFSFNYCTSATSSPL